MKRKISIVMLSIFSIFCFTNTFAQGFNKKKQTQEDIKKLEEMRKETITHRVNLTEEQTKPFWLVYDAYTKEKTVISDKLRDLKRSGRTQSDAELKKNFESRFSLREQEIDLERKYFDKFLEVISIRQVLELYEVEKHLRKKIVKHFRERQKEGRKGKNE